MKRTLDIMKKYISFVDIFKYIGFILCCISAEVVFRIQPPMTVRYVLITDEVPILFDSLYALIFATIMAIISEHSKRLKHIVYVLIYTFFCIFMFSQYIYCRIFDRVYGLKTLQYAGEGGDFAAMVWSYFDKSTFLLLSTFLVIGIVGWFLVPNFPLKIKSVWKSIICCVIIAGSIGGILLIPMMFKEPPESGGGTYRFKKVVFEEWIDNKRAVSMFGAYEFLVRDCYMFFQQVEVSEEDVDTVTAYFSQNNYQENDMTGLFEGKNLILVLMESMDDWLINEETTPTICRMMNEGINFTNMYTPIFGSAATLNSEICSYTGLVAPADGTPLVNYTNNYYPYSLPNLFKGKGYTSKSFHYNSGEFYNRENIHNSAGFEEYVSFLDYEEDSAAQQDSTLVNNKDIYKKLVGEVPFFDFVITFSAHSTMGVAKGLLQKVDE